MGKIKPSHETEAPTYVNNGRKTRVGYNPMLPKTAHKTRSEEIVQPSRWVKPQSRL